MKSAFKTIKKKNKSSALHLRRKIRVRKIVSGTKDRPRLSVFKSAKHIYVQAIDDTSSVTLASACSLEASIKEKVNGLKKSQIAKLVGEMIGNRLKDSQISSAVFDRNGFRYTGRIAAVADGARSSGLVI